MTSKSRRRLFNKTQWMYPDAVITIAASASMFIGPEGITEVSYWVFDYLERKIFYENRNSNR